MENTASELNFEQQQLAGLLDELNLDSEGEIVIRSDEDEGEGEPVVDLSSVIGDLEDKEQLEAAYEQAEKSKTEAADAFDPSAGVDPLQLLGAPVEKPKPAKAKKKAEAKPKVEKKKAEPKVKAEAKPKVEKPKVEKPAPQPRKHYASKVERLGDRLGEKMSDFVMLTTDDVERDREELKAEFNATMKSAGVKVQNRIGFITEFVSKRTARLNKVCATAIKLLLDEGKLTTGEQGNLHKALMGQSYTVAAAKAMGGNTVLALQKLKIVSNGGKGAFVPNPNSLYLPVLKGSLVAEQQAA
jgi:hypothetical protein